jgi:basic membrane lipoprotein Med (substrate-binding protein (PBP1-ABC) superfamily)
LGGEAFTLQLKNGGLKMVFNPEYKLPADVKAAADKAIEDIKSGAIKVNP